MDMKKCNEASRSELNTPTESSTFRPAAICHYGNLAIMVSFTIYFFIIPFCTMIYYLSDPNLKNGGMPRVAHCMHRSLTPKYEKWARERVACGIAKELSVNDISGTEWPVFGSAFYLWATESLQQAWEKNHHKSSVPPREYASGAISAAADLIADQGHASWVIKHWGRNYLHRENLFYRTLLISGLTSYQKLLGSEKYMPLLRDQVETLATELDRSPYGLLDDYPGECYPTDVLTAIASIKRADSILGTDHTDFVQRSRRAFEGNLLDPIGLPPYRADSKRGRIFGRVPGCGNSFMLIWAPEVWPDTAKKWYERYEKHFWQKKWGLWGFREFPKGVPDSEWYFDVDSGPVMAGHGASASAFGLGASRANGRFDHTLPLSAELIAISWPLPDGTMLGGRVFSNLSHAPYLGESSLLFALTRMPVEGVEIVKGGRIPALVYCCLALYLGIIFLLVMTSLNRLRRWNKRASMEQVLSGKIQLAVWATLIAAGVIAGVVYSLCFALPLILLAQLLPRCQRNR